MIPKPGPKPDTDSAANDLQAQAQGYVVGNNMTSGPETSLPGTIYAF